MDDDHLANVVSGHQAGGVAAIRRAFQAGLLAVLAFAAIPRSEAVEISGGARGEALILPVFTTRNGFNTLIGITNANPGTALAVKVRFRGRDGGQLLALNIYLPGGGAWTTAMKPSGTGSSAFVLSDDSCAFVDDAGSPAVASDLAVPSLEGFVEIFEMGELTAHDELVNEHDCEGLRTLWDEGDWAIDANDGIAEPKGSLRASSSLIDVSRGTMYSVVATALAGFSDVPQHTPPTDPTPNLATAHDAGTEGGATASRVCEQSTCYLDQWARPIDAVSAALTTHELTAEFVIDPAIAASSEWAVLFPTRHYYEQGEPLSLATASLLIVDRQGERDVEFCFRPPPPVDFVCETSYSIDFAQSLDVLSFNDLASQVGETEPSAILGIPHEVTFPMPGRSMPTIGYARLGLIEATGYLESMDGTRYSGLPAIAVALQEYVNGQLVGEDDTPLRANYGNSFIISRKGLVVE